MKSTKAGTPGLTAWLRDAAAPVSLYSPDCIDISINLKPVFIEFFLFRKSLGYGLEQFQIES
jgi:hypothetical protein